MPLSPIHNVLIQPVDELSGSDIDAFLANPDNIESSESLFRAWFLNAKRLKLDYEFVQDDPEINESGTFYFERALTLPPYGWWGEDFPPPTLAIFDEFGREIDIYPVTRWAREPNQHDPAVPDPEISHPGEPNLYVFKDPVTGSPRFFYARLAQAVFVNGSGDLQWSGSGSGYSSSQSITETGYTCAVSHAGLGQTGTTTVTILETYYP